jgi:CheY-like chemotaxis protein/class 3 adenylate cyclase/predicted metal-dependent HD superfamily phosphohydrolase
MANNGGRMLVVDDNRINRMMLQRALAQEGYEVATAEHGRQALEMLGAQLFDVVLLDILMPEMDGYETLARIKADHALRHIPVIMISAVDEMDSVVRCIEMGATDYLPKPFNPALLRARINASLAEKRLRDLEREYLEQVGYVASFDPDSLNRVAGRSDALGRLARVFQRMAREVYLREQRLNQQLQQLHLDIEEMRRAFVEPLCVYLPMDRRQALVCGQALPDRTSGAALFADISGFTPLTAALAHELGLLRGAEELTRLLNEVYGVLIAEVHRYGGSVIGFSGDAVTCWLDGDSGLRAVACGLAMQAAMAPFASIQTPAGTSVSLAIKVAVAAGPVRRFLVGDPSIQNVEVIAGRTLDRLAGAEQQAGGGQVVATADIVAQVGARIAVAAWREDPETGQRVAVVAGLAEPVPALPWPELPPDCLPDSLCRPWLWPAVVERMSSGTKQFLAELRPVVALFLHFGGIDYDADDGAGDKLDLFLRWAQAIVHCYQGTLVQLTVGDKGSYLYAAFGTPIAHQDDQVRAVQAALELRLPPPGLSFLTGIQMGLAEGRMRTGAYGSPTQRTYGALGDKTNLAARLMQVAGGDILCDETVYQAARSHLGFRALPPIQVKGRAEPIAVYRPNREATQAQSQAAIQARIDALSPFEQLTLKVASVIACARAALASPPGQAGASGRSFAAETLSAIFPVDSEKPNLGQHLAALERAGLIEQVSPEPVFAFRDPAVQQVAYDLMLFAQRRPLHRLVAEWYERTCSENLAPHYALLAHHWRQAEVLGRAVEYLEKAGQQALRAGAYEEAQRYLQHSLELDARAGVLSNGFHEHPPADWEAARQAALARLERDLPPELTYHSLWHTVADVLPAVQRLAALTGLGEEETHLVETAAVYHDLGFTVQRQEHERMGADITAQILPGLGFTPAQIAAIQGMIMATQLPQSPRTPLEEILADADLDVLGRDDFLVRNKDLRDELAVSGIRISDGRWYSSQLQMLQTHHYWTAAARSLRAEGKQKNIETVKHLLAQAAAAH